jgi:hypothetical protein
MATLSISNRTDDETDDVSEIQLLILRNPPEEPPPSGEDDDVPEFLLGDEQENRDSRKHDALGCLVNMERERDLIPIADDGDEPSSSSS